MAEHTPTPWRYSARNREIWANDDLVLYMPTNVDGDYRGADCDGNFIVRAVNAHEALTAAIMPLVLVDENNPPPGVLVEHWRPAVLAARAAIGLARGEKP